MEYLTAGEMAEKWNYQQGELHCYVIRDELKWQMILL